MCCTYLCYSALGLGAEYSMISSMVKIECEDEKNTRKMDSHQRATVLTEALIWSIIL